MVWQIPFKNNLSVDVSASKATPDMVKWYCPERHPLYDSIVYAISFNILSYFIQVHLAIGTEQRPIYLKV